MFKQLYYIILVIPLAGLQTKGQTLLLDSLKAGYEREEISLIRIPAHYEKISEKFGLSEIKKTDSFSLRLWLGSMNGYSLSIFTKQNYLSDRYKYHYTSDTTISEIKLLQKFPNQIL